MPRPPTEPPDPALSGATVSALIAVAAKGDHRATLEATRDALTEAMGPATPAEVATLSKQLRDTLAAIAALPEPDQTSEVDEVAKRRAVRRAGAKVQPRAARKNVGGSGSGGSGRKRGADPGPSPGAGTRRRAGRTA